MPISPPVSCPVSLVVCVVRVGCCDILAVAPHPLLVLVLVLLPKVAIYTLIGFVRWTWYAVRGLTNLSYE